MIGILDGASGRLFAAEIAEFEFIAEQAANGEPKPVDQLPVTSSLLP